MKPVRQRDGYILPVVVFLLALVGVVVASTVGYVSNAARQTRIYLARTRCRLAAQSVIEQAKAQIQSGFSDYSGGSGAASVKVDPRRAEVYNWFDNISGDRKTVGIGTKTVTLKDAVVNDCSVCVAIGMSVDHTSNSSVAKVPIVATAVYEHPDGLRVTVTIQERVIFGTGRSKVFDYAYFVNNYGWMSGSSITINGDMRANGNVSLSSSTVNGFVYAAANDELDVDGTVTLKGSPKIKSASAYRSASSTTSRSRPDTEDFSGSSEYDAYRKSAYDAPESSGTIRAPTYKYTTYTDAETGETITEKTQATPGTVASLSDKSIVNDESDSLPMPFVSDLDSYVEYAKEKNGRLTYPSYSYTDTFGTNQTVGGGTVYAHYSGTGPSGVEGNADQGALVLVGTKANPIVIDGPVVVDSDVIITGYVTGQGTIYSGRNIHIIGDVQYVNAPSWSHPDSDDVAVNEANDAKDMLGLVAKGNIVIGDSSDTSWHSSVDSYIKSSSSASVVHSYACDASDANIGYPSTFAGDYTAVEKVTTLSAEQALKAPGGYDSDSGQFGKIRTVKTYTEGTHTEWTQDRWGRWYQATVQNYVESEGVSYDRRYYETVCSDSVLKSLKNSSGISVVDAILYNNHAVMGTPGRSGYSFNLNGSLVCRDEALIFSGNGINFNWDYRLRNRDDDTSDALGLPVGPQDPYTCDWLEVPDSLNPSYTRREGDL